MTTPENTRQKKISNVLKEMVDKKKALEKHVRSGKPITLLKDKGFRFVTPI